MSARLSFPENSASPRTATHTFHAVAFVENFALRSLAPHFPGSVVTPHELRVALARGETWLFPFGVVVFRDVSAEQTSTMLDALRTARPRPLRRGGARKLRSARGRGRRDPSRGRRPLRRPPHAGAGRRRGAHHGPERGDGVLRDAWSSTCASACHAGSSGWSCAARCRYGRASSTVSWPRRSPAADEVLVRPPPPRQAGGHLGRPGHGSDLRRPARRVRPRGSLPGARDRSSARSRTRWQFWSRSPAIVGCVLLEVAIVLLIALEIVLGLTRIF